MLSRLILISTAIYLSIFIWFNRSIFQPNFDPKLAQDRYYNSAYIRGDKASYIISDSELYATEGYFLIGRKFDLEKLTPGHPPLGKYLIGVSNLIFHNPYIISLIAGILTLYFIYRISILLNFSPFLSSLSVLIFSLEPLFTEQLTTSLLDIYLLLFSLISLYLYLYWQKHNHFRYLALSQLFLGFAFATKFWPTSAPLAVALFFPTLLSGNFQKFITHIKAFFFIPLGFALGHLTYFFYHPSPFSFIKYQRFIISWWAGSPQVAPLKVWNLIYQNQWQTWWGDFAAIPVNSWWIGWPILISLAIISPLITKFIFHRKLPIPFIIFYIWLIISLLMFSFEAIYPRHLFTIIPASIFLSLNLLKFKVK